MFKATELQVCVSRLMMPAVRSTLRESLPVLLVKSNDVKSSQGKTLLATSVRSAVDKGYTKLDNAVCTRYDDIRPRRRSSNKTPLLPLGVLAVLA